MSEPICFLDECNERAWRRSVLCARHYRCFLRGATNPTPHGEVPCDFVEGCTNRLFAQGVCRPHFNEKYGFSIGQRVTSVTGRVCVVDECDRKHYGLGYCVGHYQQFKRGETPGKIRGPAQWKKNPNGYVNREITIGGVKTIELQHRRVMAEHIGRELEPHEQVHHINGQRDQNNIENLELWSVSQPAGQRVLDKLAWAREIISLYEPLEDTL